MRQLYGATEKIHPGVDAQPEGEDYIDHIKKGRSLILQTRYRPLKLTTKIAWQDDSISFLVVAFTLSSCIVCLSHMPTTNLAGVVPSKDME